MKTFDEAVNAVMVAEPGNRKAAERLLHIQSAFTPDIAASKTLFDFIRRVATMHMLCGIDALEEVDLDSETAELQTTVLVMSFPLSSFAWGLAVGRQMEQPDMDELERKVAGA